MTEDPPHRVEADRRLSFEGLGPHDLNEQAEGVLERVTGGQALDDQVQEVALIPRA